MIRLLIASVFDVAAVHVMHSHGVPYWAAICVCVLVVSATMIQLGSYLDYRAR